MEDMTPDLPKACFDVLPAEIRQYIWSLCLPERTIEFVFKHRDDKPADDKPTVPNWVWEARVHHADPLSWYKLTREAYEIASNYGFTNKKLDPLSLIAAGIDPCAPPDKWLISWDLKSKGREDFRYSPLDEFFKVVEDEISKSSSKAAKPAPFISYREAFDTNQLHLFWNRPERRKTPITFPTNLLPEFGIEFWSPESWKELENTVHNRYDLLAMAKNYQRTDKWASFTITLHGKRRRELPPGLFGEFGENPILFVHLYDEDTAWQLQELYKMWQNESPAHDDRTKSIFEYLFRPAHYFRPEHWANVLLDRFIIATWADDRARGVVDAKGAWSPEVLDDQLPVLREHRLVTGNTWGRRVVAEIRAQPQNNNYVVFRACYRGHCWEPSNGVTVQFPGVYSQGQLASAKEQVYLRLYGSTKPPASVDNVEELDYTTDTVWSLKTNGYGKSQIYTQKYFLNDGSSRKRTVWYLARDDKHQSKLTFVKIADKDKNGNKDKIEEIVARSFWDMDMVAAPVADLESKKINACLCTLKHGSNYVALESDAHTKVPKRLVIASQSKIAAPTTRYVYQWMLRAQSLKPTGVSYLPEHWQLTTDDTASAFSH